MRSSTLVHALLFVLCLFVFTHPILAEQEKQLTVRDAEGTPLLEAIRMIGTVTVSADGSIEVTTDESLICDGPAADCDDVAVGGLDFSASSLEVEVGEVLEFSWYSRGAWECDAGGDLPGWSERTALPPDSRRASSAQRRVSTADLDGDFPLSFTAELLCYNGPVESDDGLPNQLAILIEEIPDPEEGVPEECATVARRPPSSWARLGTGPQSCHWSGNTFLSDSDCTFWEGVWPRAFTANTNSLSRYLGNRSSDGKDYIAIRFNSGDFADDYRNGNFRFDGAPNIRTRERLVSLSRCPGDFNRAAIASELGSGCIRRMTGRTGSVGWGGPESSGPTCILEQNTDYFLNIVFTESSLDGVTWDSIEPHPDCRGPSSAEFCGTALEAR